MATASVSATAITGQCTEASGLYVNMSDCAYSSNSPLGQWGPVKMSGCAYGSKSPLGQVKSIIKAFMLLLRVRLANKSRLVLVGAALQRSMREFSTRVDN